MNLLDLIASPQNSGLLNQLSQQFGLNQNQTQEALRHMVPAITRGIQKNAATPDGLGALLNALNKGQHNQYVDNPETLRRPETAQDGNGILGHIFGSKDISRNVAGYAAQQSGVDSSILKQMLPVVASIVMGSMKKQIASPSSHAQSGGGNAGGLGGLVGQVLGGLGGGGRTAPASPQASLLTSLLDTNKDGSVADDLLNIAKKFF